MEWSRQNDVLLCTEITLRVRQPYKFKKCSNERGKIWTEIASTLNSNEEVKFHVTQRGVRERYEGLKAKYLEKIKNEEKASGISPEATELDSLLEEIIEKESLAESSRESDSAIKKNEEERKIAEDLRPGGGGYSPKIPIRVCAAQRGRDFGTPYLERGIHFRDVS